MWICFRQIHCVSLAHSFKFQFPNICSSPVELCVLEFLGNQETHHSFLGYCMCLCVSDSLWPHDCSLPNSSVHGISQARMLEWLAISFSRGSSQPRNWTHVSCVSCLGRWVLYPLSHRSQLWPEALASFERFWEIWPLSLHSGLPGQKLQHQQDPWGAGVHVSFDEHWCTEARTGSASSLCWPPCEFGQIT